MAPLAAPLQDRLDLLLEAHRLRSLALRGGVAASLSFCGAMAPPGGIARNAGDFPIPVAIVPGHLSDEELDAMS